MNQKNKLGKSLSLFCASSCILYFASAAQSDPSKAPPQKNCAAETLVVKPSQSALGSTPLTAVKPNVAISVIGVIHITLVTLA